MAFLWNFEGIAISKYIGSIYYLPITYQILPKLAVANVAMDMSIDVKTTTVIYKLH